MKDSGNRFVMPALVLLSLVTIYPILYVFYLSLHRRLLIFDISRFVGIDNYLFLLVDFMWNEVKMKGTGKTDEDLRPGDKAFINFSADKVIAFDNITGRRL